VSNSWNAGGCCGTAQASRIDDVSFARAMVSYIKSRANINDSQVSGTIRFQQKSLIF
jgi:hypothetical protein